MSCVDCQQGREFAHLLWLGLAAPLDALGDWGSHVHDQISLSNGKNRTKVPSPSSFSGTPCPAVRPPRRRNRQLIKPIRPPPFFFSQDGGVGDDGRVRRAAPPLRLGRPRHRRREKRWAERSERRGAAQASPGTPRHGREVDRPTRTAGGALILEANQIVEVRFEGGTCDCTAWIGGSSWRKHAHEHLVRNMVLEDVVMVCRREDEPIVQRLISFLCIDRSNPKGLMRK